MGTARDSSSRFYPILFDPKRELGEARAITLAKSRLALRLLL
jgi:hypothetical protein